MIGFGASRFGGVGGSPISNPGVAYVMSDGDNSTGEIGNPAKPFLTAAAAVTAFGAVTSMSFVFGVGTFTANAILDSGVTSCHITGQGHTRTIVNMTWVGDIGASGVSGEPGVVTDGGGGEGFDGIIITSDQSADLRINLTGGNGGGGGDNTGETGTGGGGGNGGDIGVCTLRGVYGSFSALPGSGGTEGSGPEGSGTPGASGSVSALEIQFSIITTAGDVTFGGPMLSIVDDSPYLDN